MIRMVTFAFILASAGLMMADDSAKKEDPTEKPASELNTTRLKASYAIGISIGKSLKADGLEVDVETLVKGLSTSLAGGESKLTVSEIREAISAFQQEMQIKLAERRQVQGEKNKVEGAKFLAKNEKREGVVTLESGLQYEVIKRGKGKRPTSKDKVKTHYHGTLLDGTVFDSSVEREEPISFGVTGVIAGWTEALQLMKEGDKWRLFVPSKLAYKERGAGDDIGPHATLIFEVELLEVE